MPINVIVDVSGPGGGHIRKSVSVQATVNQEEVQEQVVDALARLRDWFQEMPTKYPELAAELRKMPYPPDI